MNETRAWRAWADRLGVSPLTLFALLGSVIELGEHHRNVFEVLRPGFDIERESERRNANDADTFDLADLYPDAIPCLHQLRTAGYQVGVAGNHSARFSRRIRELDLPVDLVGSSAEWQVEKPAPEFFVHLVQLAQAAPTEVAYVGDRVDNDVLPAKAAGLISVFLRRGPWGSIQGRWPDAGKADFQLNSLAELAPVLESLR